MQGAEVDVTDVSGNSGSQNRLIWYSGRCRAGGCGSFMKVQVISTEFAGKPVVKQHRLVRPLRIVREHELMLS